MAAAVEVSLSKRCEDKDMLPPGYCRSAVEETASAQSIRNMTPLLQKQADSIGWRPASSLLSLGFMTFMMGNQLTVWSIFILIPMFSQPFTQLFGMEAAFKAVDKPGVSLVLPKIKYLMCVMAGFCLAGYKLYQLGLLPLAAADWAHLLAPTEYLENSWGGVSADFDGGVQQ